MTSFFDKMLAVFRRDWLTAIRYRSGFAVMAAGTLVELGSFFYLARAIGPGFRPNGIDYFGFLLVGTGLYTFLMMSVNSFLSTIQEAQQTGTLEVLMTTPTPPAVLVFLSSVSALGRNLAQFFLYMGVGLILFHAPVRANLLGCVVIFLFVMMVATALGIFAAAIQVAIQRGSAAVWLLGSALWFLTGTIFPVSSLPRPLQKIATLVPITSLLDAMRRALLEGASWHELSPYIITMSMFASILLPLSLLTLSWTLRRARISGTLSFY
jgi:ABC-2 type transport system permease protein